MDFIKNVKRIGGSMKKLIITVGIITILGLLVSLAFSKEKEPLTDLETYKIQLNKAIDQRAHHIKMTKQYEYQMIQLKAVIDYITEKEKETKEVGNEKGK